MEPPIVPTSARPQRLIRDYSGEDDVPTGRTSKSAVDGRPRGFDIEAPRSQSTTSWLETDGQDGRGTAFRMRSPDRTQRPQKSHQPEPYQDYVVGAQASAQDQQEELRKLDFNLERIDEQTDVPDTNTEYARSISSMSRASERTGITSSSGSRLPDFFSAEIFQVVLHNPTTAHQFLKFSRSRLCGEHMEFLERVDRYHTLLNETSKLIYEIHRDFISTSAPSQINLPAGILNKVNKDLRASLSSTLPKLESVFVDSQTDVERLVSMDIYPRFVRHQMTLSATRALAAPSTSTKYAGLGDCFVLTDPAKADNPIVFASDGFVSVTGYARNEIIPRNCRFLQCRQTDRGSVKRLKTAIDKREESVELLLNQKKNGEPFWNLLYTCPLVDAMGNVVFFLGGQINCSTTIHSASDILKILAMSEDVSEEKDVVRNGNGVDPIRSRSSRFFSAWKTKPAVQAKAVAGMEGQVVGKIEKMGLKKQMDAFYTSYSKVSLDSEASRDWSRERRSKSKGAIMASRQSLIFFLTLVLFSFDARHSYLLSSILTCPQYIIINPSTYFISFHSAGIEDLLYPSRVPYGNGRPQLVGQDIFAFLAHHTQSANLPSGFKSKVKAAIKEGKALSLEFTLCTRRYHGFEKFVVHWTQLKGEKGEVGWVVVTLGSAGDA